MANESNEWAKNEFGDAVLGDKRLTDRLVKIADSLISLPESSINEACGSWSEAKAAYRFFQNENVKESDILATHINKTVERTKAHKRVLVIQDTSYIVYNNHKKTSGLANLSSYDTAKGIIMHTALAVSIEGLVLGILDQKVYSRPEETENLKKKSDRIEDKESVKWLETLRKTNNIIDPTQTETITVCDREADIYDFFELAHNLNSAVLVRACRDRAVNRKSRYPEKGEQKLWAFIKSSHCAGTVEVEVPVKDNKPKRTARLEVRFGKFMMNPSKNNIRHKTEELPKLPLYAVYVVEKTSLPLKKTARMDAINESFS